MSTTPTPKDPAVKGEANDTEHVTVEWRGLTFTIPADRGDWSFEAEVAIEEGKYAIAIRELLPAAQYREFLAKRPTSRDGAELIDVIANALGFSDAGESPASSA